MRILEGEIDGSFRTRRGLANERKKLPVRILSIYMCIDAVGDPHLL